MASTVQIANLALDAIGARATIANFQETSAEARLLARQYDQALEDVLAAAHWNFARKQAALTLLKDGSLSPPDDVPAPWVYEYAYPSDCVAARYVMPSLQSDPNVVGTGAAPFAAASPVRFIISTDEDSNGNAIKVILTNQPAAVLVYTSRVTNSQLYDGPFVRALANYLGALIAIPLSGDKALARSAFQVADATTKSARASNGNEGGPTVIDVVPDWIAARGYQSDMGQGSNAYVMSPSNLVFVT